MQVRIPSDLHTLSSSKKRYYTLLCDSIINSFMFSQQSRRTHVRQQQTTKDNNRAAREEARQEMTREQPKTVPGMNITGRAISHEEAAAEAEKIAKAEKEIEDEIAAQAKKNEKKKSQGPRPVWNEGSQEALDELTKNNPAKRGVANNPKDLSETDLRKIVENNIGGDTNVKAAVRELNKRGINVATTLKPGEAVDVHINKGTRKPYDPSTAFAVVKDTPDSDGIEKSVKEKFNDFLKKHGDFINKMDSNVYTTVAGQTVKASDLKKMLNNLPPVNTSKPISRKEIAKLSPQELNVARNKKGKDIIEINGGKYKAEDIMDLLDDEATNRQQSKGRQAAAAPPPPPPPNATAKAAAAAPPPPPPPNATAKAAAAGSPPPPGGPPPNKSGGGGKPPEPPDDNPFKAGGAADDEMDKLLSGKNNNGKYMNILEAISAGGGGGGPVDPNNRAVRSGLGQAGDTVHGILGALLAGGAITGAVIGKRHLDKRAAEEARKALLRKVGIGAALGTGGIAAAILAKKAADEDDAKREAMYEAMYGDGGYR